MAQGFSKDPVDDLDAVHLATGSEISTLAEKVTPVNADLIIIEDSADSNLKKKVQVGNLPGTGGTDTDAIHDNVANEISAVTEKLTPVNADILLLEDSAAGYTKKRVQVGNLPTTSSDTAAIHDNVANEIAAVAEKVTPVSGDLLLIEDSAAGNAKKRVQIGNLPGGAGSDADAIHDNVAGEIVAVTEKTALVANDEFLVEDSAAGNTKKSAKIGAIFVSTLGDVDTSGILNGQILKWNSTNQAFEAADDDVGSGTVPDGSATNDGLVWDGAQWVARNTVLPNITNPQDGDIIEYDSGTGQWINAAPSTGGGSSPFGEVVVAASDAPTSVKLAADYVCSGSNDQVQINSAIDAAFQSNPAGIRSGVVLIGQFFDISASILMKAAVQLRGLGFGTIIRANGLSTGRGMIELADKNHHMTSLRDFTLWGNFAAGGACHGIYYLQSNGGDGDTGLYDPGNSPDASHRIVNLYVKNFGNTGIRHGIYMADNVRDANIQLIRGNTFTGNGIRWDGASDGKTVSCIIQNAGSSGGAYAGYHVGGGSNQLVMCKAAYNDYDGFNVTSSRAHLTACHAQDNGRHGFYVNSVDAAISAPVADSNSRLSSTAYGIYMDTGADRCMIGNASIYDRGQTPGSPQNRGVFFSSGASDVWFTGTVRLASGSTYFGGTPASGSYVRMMRIGSSFYTFGG